MKDKNLLQQGSRGCLISCVNIAAAIFAMVISTVYQYPNDPSCNGNLGAGFPALFICDDWGGGSPTGSWEKIDFIDVPNGGIRPLGFVIDFLFYALLIWSVLVWGGSVLKKRINQYELGWVASISFIFTMGYIGVSVLFFSSRLYVDGYRPRATATPMLPSPTALGTMSAEPLSSTPVP